MENDFSFETAYKRLETILEKLGSGEIPLEESLTLYEEADKLISTCQSKLSHAEQKIQIMVKNRELTSNKPQLQDFEC